MAVSLITTTLMPVSQAVAWFLVFEQELYSSIFKVSLFYCLWALYNKYLGGLPQELGHISMGFLALSAYYRNRTSSMIACGLVFFNFAAPAILIVVAWSPEKLAEKVKKDTSSAGIMWAYIFKLYFVSNMALWGNVLYKLYTTNDGATSSPFSRAE